MHLIVPYAGVLGDAGAQALRGLRLPHLARLLARLSPAERDAGDEYSLSPPHERALAQALGWHAADGQFPWAAHHAALDGVATGEQPWGLLTPVHQEAGTELVSLADPAGLALDEAASRELLEAVRELFESEGFTLAWGAPLRWYVAHPSLAGLACASLDRVVGRHINAWLPQQREARLLRRLQNEVQMLLYTHDFNDRREAAGQVPVNSFWFSGCGVAQVTNGESPVVDDRLRSPALNADWPAWVEAWQALDAGPLQQALAHDGPFSLTLAGERHAQRFEPVPLGLWQRAQRVLRRPDVPALLESL